MVSDSLVREFINTQSFSVSLMHTYVRSKECHMDFTSNKRPNDMARITTPELADAFIEGARAAGHTVNKIFLGKGELNGCRGCGERTGQHRAGAGALTALEIAVGGGH